MESNEEMKTIKINRSNILKFGILDENDKPTDEFIEFDLEDIELPLRLQESTEKHKKNLRWFKTALELIEKKPNYQGKKLLSSHQEEQLRVFNEMYQKEIEAFDYAFGLGTARKLLHGRKPYLSMFDDFVKSLGPVMEQIKNGYTDLKAQIIEKYGKKEDDVIE